MAFRILADVEHVLLRPSVYTGFDYGVTEMVALVVEDGRIKAARVPVDRIALKVFDEILVNACDCIKRVARAGAEHSVAVDLGDEGFRIENDGSDIPLGRNEEWGCHVPHALFGMLRSSCNYDDGAERTGGGVNGLGCKLTNIMCARMEVCVSDGASVYTQTFTENMRRASEPVVAPLGASMAPRTVRITATLDATRCSWSAHTRSACARRVFDAAACYPDVRVTLDGARVPSAAHEPYAGMYAGEPVLLKVPGYVVYVAEASERGLTASFVNGVSTPDHGAHVARTLRRLYEAVAPDGDEAQWRRFVADKLFLLVFARLDRPVFKGNEKASVGLPLRPEPCKLDRAQVKKLARVGAMWTEWAACGCGASARPWT